MNHLSSKSCSKLSLYSGLPMSKGPCAEYLVSYSGKDCSESSHAHNFFQEFLAGDCLRRYPCFVPPDAGLFFYDLCSSQHLSMNNQFQSGLPLCAMDSGGRAKYGRCGTQ
jgi:hypothetical protein